MPVNSHNSHSLPQGLLPLKIMVANGYIYIFLNSAIDFDRGGRNAWSVYTVRYTRVINISVSCIYIIYNIICICILCICTYNINYIIDPKYFCS